MPTTFLYINDAKLDSFGDVWAVGRDLTKYDGESWSYYDSSNSIVPSNLPYFLDTRSISIDNYDNKWVGCAVTASLSQSLIFYAEGPEAATGSSWSLSQFGDLANISPNWEVPTIFASPFAQEVLAFISPLNGGAGTGGTGNIGVTGGYLWRYDLVSESWSEVAPGYSWPHIYDITAKGLDGSNFEYYLSTDDGLQIIPPGNLDPETLDDGSLYIPQLKKSNSFTSGIGGNIVYSVSFDENGNFWAGTENGISYWDGKKYYTWNYGSGVGVTKVVSRNNGHVFFRIGDPFLITSTSVGFYHFNGDTFTQYTSSNSSLPDDRVISILLVDEKSQAGSLTIYEKDLWIVAGNYVTLFDYVLPHVYATSKYTGTTGWNFVDYTYTTEGATTDTARIPKADKYSWVYPSWRSYENKYLENLHPGLDPRNLFLEANFKDIANGNAGTQDYWNKGEIIPTEERDLQKLIPDYEWLTSTTSFEVTSVSKYKNLNVVSGFSDQPVISLGEVNNNLPSYSLTNPNPTNSSGGTANVGFVSLYTDAGQLTSVIPFRGFETKVYKAIPSLNDSSLFIVGTFKKFIEFSEFVYASNYPGAALMNVTGVTGPTGGPIGFSNLETPGITSGYDYPWILNAATGATSGIYLPDTSFLEDREAIFIAEIDVDLGNAVSYGDIDFSQTNALASRFCLKNFRYFPGADGSFDPTGVIDPNFPTPLTFENLDLSVAKNSVRLTSNFLGGISTLKNGWTGQSDLPGSPEFIFSAKQSATGSYDYSGSLVDMNGSLDLIGGFTVGLSGAGTSYLDGITSLTNASTYILTGTSTYNVVSPQFTITHPQPGYSLPYFQLNDSNHIGITAGFLVNNAGQTGSGYTAWYNTIKGFKSQDQYYLNLLYTSNGYLSNSSSQIDFYGTTGSVNIATIGVKPGGLVSTDSYYQFLDESYGSPYLVSLSDQSDTLENGDQYSSIYFPYSPGITGNGHVILKRNVSGTYIDEFSTFSVGNTGDQSQLKFHVDQDLDVFVAGSNSGGTGPENLPYSSATGSFVSMLESYKPGVGIDLGNIISRAGTAAWSWVDVHNSSSDIFVPLLSTVFMNNYDSKIFGKTNNRWVLANSISGEVLLDVRDVQYFIYTFTQSGYYSIQNSVEDAAGNVYEVSKPAYIKVVNQTIPRPDDPNPEFVNSYDYGFIEPYSGAGTQYNKLGKSLLEQQVEIMLQSVVPFGSALIIPDNPDATFNPL